MKWQKLVLQRLKLLTEAVKIGSIIKIWTCGNLQLGHVKQEHKHKKLVQYYIIRTLKYGSDYNRFVSEEVSSIDNVITNYGVVSYEEHRELYPEYWI